MRKRTASAIEKAWRDLDKLVAKWDEEGYPEIEYPEIVDPPTLPTISDTHYTDVSQLAQWRKENS